MEERIPLSPGSLVKLYPGEQILFVSDTNKPPWKRLPREKRCLYCKTKQNPGNTKCESCGAPQ